MPPSGTRPSPSDRRERLTLSKLASYDDVATDAMVDRAYFWTNTRKNRPKYIPVRGINDDDVARILLHDVVVAKDVMKAEQALLAVPGLKRYMARLPNDREKDWFRRHLRKYIQIYLPDCPFEVTTTNRYTIMVHEAAICARKFIKQGQEIKYLSGTLVPMTQEEEQDLGLTRKDFSIVMSSRKKTPSFFLGPARFANHDCNANARLVTRGSEGMQVVAIRDIHIGEEVTVSYGEDYFGIDNCECLCLSCERVVRNGWAPHVDSEPESKEPSPALNDENASAGVDSSPKKKRIYAQDSDSESPFPTPRKRGKFEPQSSKLREEMSLPEVAISIDSAPEDHHQSSTMPEVHGELKGTNAESAGTETDPSTSNGLVPASTDCESPTSGTTEESRQSSTLTSPTSVCGTAVEVKVEEEAEASEEKPISTAVTNVEQLPTDEQPGTVVERKKRKYQRRRFLVPSDEDQAHRVRVPGDYIKTSKLLAQPYDRWVECRTCECWFVQGNSYLTRRECPRCERHSKLYGFRWPKTDKEGPLDDEERVMDHRTIHRFLYPEEEAQILHRGRGVSFGITPTPDLSDTRTETDGGSERTDDTRNVRTTRRRTRQIRVMM
ncbi:Histone-lysine N-methyltransferase set9 [Monascus purpureus]|nr:Histone-lysine N-methyltransferase set9 [Monascus purpureus]